MFVNDLFLFGEAIENQIKIVMENLQSSKWDMILMRGKLIVLLGRKFANLNILDALVARYEWCLSNKVSMEIE